MWKFDVPKIVLDILGHQNQTPDLSHRHLNFNKYDGSLLGEINDLKSEENKIYRSNLPMYIPFYITWYISIRSTS